MSRSNQDWDGFDDDEDMGADDNLVKRLRAELKKRDAQINELSEANTKLQSSVSQRNVADVLQSKGVKSGLSRYILRDLKEDGEDVTPEAVERWLNDNAEVFGLNLGGSEEGQDSDAPRGAEGVSSDDVDALRNISTTEGSALPPEASRSLQAELESSDLTQERLLTLIGQLPNRN